MPILPKRILIVDDNQDIRDLLTLVLKQASHDVAAAASIREAIYLINRGQFDLYVVDGWLPDGNGASLCQQIKSLHPEAVIVFHSASDYPAEKELALASGAQAYFTKPVDPYELTNSLDRLLQSPPEDKG